MGIFLVWQWEREKKKPHFRQHAITAEVCEGQIRELHIIAIVQMHEKEAIKPSFAFDYI